MPYKTTSDLPANLQKILPKHAQEIYKDAFNNAIKEYKDPSKRRNKSEDADAIASKVAWTAVKKQYKKDKTTEKWVEK